MLKARAVVLRFFAVAFGEEPSATTLAALSNPGIAEAFELMAGAKDDPVDFKRRITSMNSVLEQHASSTIGIERLGGEYTMLFVGPGSPAAPPWESSHRTSSKTIFQEATLEVRNFYRTQGFLPSEYPKVADDHIALEFAFLAELATRAASAYCRGEGSSYNDALDASALVFDDHLLRWLPLLKKRMESIDAPPFYQSLADLACAYAATDRELLQNLLAT